MKWLSDESVTRLRQAADEPDLSDTRYRLIRKIGSGGMSDVYLAEDTLLNRDVAVKIMTVHDAGDLATRMSREAKILARLEHPSIVPIHDVGVLADGRVFYAMKYVRGRRLDECVRAGAQLTDLLRIFQRICEAVSFAHSFGVIHRDLKPENIMVGAFGEVLVMDWGVAKLLGDQRPQSIDSSGGGGEDLEHRATLIQGIDLPAEPETAHGIVVGTPAYMAPEQALGDSQSVSERTDVYALGAILYFMLTGRVPYDAASVAELRSKLISSTGPAKPRSVNQSIPPPLEAACLKALERDAAERYKSAEQFSADIAAFLDGLAVSAYNESFIERASRFVARNRFLVILILAYLVMRFLVLLVFKR